MRRFLSALLVSILTVGLVHAQTEEDKEKEKERLEAIAAQKKLAEEQWKGLLGGRMVTHKETDNFLLYGTVEEKELEAIGKAAEKALTQARKTLGIMPKDEQWKGKMIVNVFQQRGEFGAYSRRYANRSPNQEETGTFSHEREYSYVLAGPSAGEGKKPPLELEVVQQVASSVLTKKSGKLPDWFVSGFGRSVAYRHAPNQFGPERARAAALVKRGKTAKDVWMGNLSAEEGLVLNASFVDFLTNSSAMAKAFPEVLANFGEETMFEDALKGAKLNPDAVSVAYYRWAPSAR
jgi:hypothetical protein